MYLDDNNYHFEIDPPKDSKTVTLKVFQKVRGGSVFLRDLKDVPREKLEWFANVFKAAPKPIGNL